MHTLRRRSSRRHCFRAAKIQLGAWTRDCLVIDTSDCYCLAASILLHDVPASHRVGRCSTERQRRVSAVPQGVREKARCLRRWAVPAQRSGRSIIFLTRIVRLSLNAPDKPVHYACYVRIAKLYFGLFQQIDGVIEVLV